MLKLRLFGRTAALAIMVVLLADSQVNGQVQIGGNFLVRAYAEKYFDTRDDRGELTYMRLLGRLNMDAPITDIGKFHADLVTVSDNPVFPSRSIAGTGALRLGLSQIYGEVSTGEIPWFDAVRLRVGRQHYRLGEGLTLGESYYMLDKYDGVRVDMSHSKWSFGLFGAITEQELSESGFTAERGSEQLYVAKAEYELYNHVLLAYSVYEKQLGQFNDNIIFGFGSNGSIVLRDLQYFGEFATQTFHTWSGLPDKGGVAYMAGISYSWSQGPFRIIKVEARGAGYQGDAADTEKIEIFEPFYPTWWWGDRTAYVNGDIGGDYPHRGIQPEGSRIWYYRFYVSPNAVPKLRVQFQYASVGDWVNNDGITEPDDEFGIKVFYELNSNVRFQARYFRRMTNSDDADINDSGVITRIEDRHGAQRILGEFRVRF
jgi:hypothetical protein